MFGYIRPWKPELLVKEWEQYRAVYCGLCRRLGEVCGCISRLTLSYDGTFLSMLLLGLSNGCAGYERGRCVVNPMKQCSFCLTQGDDLDLAAALTVILAWYKLRDDWEDGGAGQKTRSALLTPLAVSGHRRALRRFPRLEELAGTYMEAQRQAEQDPQACLDACAEPTARLLEEALCYAVFRGREETPVLARVLRQLGYHLGRWIYLMDAADDWEKDLRTGSFNPFVRKFSLSGEVSEAAAAGLRSYANETLNMSMAQINGAFALLELAQFEPILRNIVTQGMPQMQRQILYQEKKENGNVGSV